MGVRKWATAALLVVAAFPVQARAQQNSVVPVDEAARDPEFFVFRARLQRAVAAHDTAAVMSVVSPRMLNSFGGNGGKDEFRQAWGVAEPETSLLWATLGFVLALGGQFDTDTSFYAPYSFRGSAVDGFEGLIVLARNVMVRAQPNGNSAVRDTVSFEAVTKWREQSPTDGWEPVRTGGGQTGWVRDDYLRSPIDYRAGFVRRQGRWWMRALVAGD